MKSYNFFPYPERTRDRDGDVKNFSLILDEVFNLVESESEKLALLWNIDQMPPACRKFLAMQLGIEFPIGESVEKPLQKVIIKNTINLYKLKGTGHSIRFLIHKLIDCENEIDVSNTYRCVCITNNFISKIFDQNDADTGNSAGTDDDLNVYTYSTDFVDGKAIIKLYDFTGGDGDLEIVKYLVNEFLGPGPYEIQQI